VARETLTALELFVATMVAARTKPRDADEIDKAIVLQEWTSQKAAEFFAEVVKRRTTQGAGGRRFLLKQAKGDQ
jgi:hypothetical protein